MLISSFSIIKNFNEAIINTEKFCNFAIREDVLKDYN